MNHCRLYDDLGPVYMTIISGSVFSMFFVMNKQGKSLPVHRSAVVSTGKIDIKEIMHSLFLSGGCKMRCVLGLVNIGV